MPRHVTFYLTGYSGGAMMTALLACDYADRFAAAAPVAGQPLISECDPTRAVPVRAFHGTDDPMLGFDSGAVPPSLTVLAEVFGDEAVAEALDEGKGDALDPIMLTEEAPGAVEVLTAWAQRNGCAATHTEEPVVDQVRRLVWDDCAPDGSTELYVIDGGGHTWPGSDAPTLDESYLGATSFEIDATELMWEFFQQHSL